MSKDLWMVKVDGCVFFWGEKNNNTNMYVWFIFGLVYSRGHYINYPLFFGGG